MRRAPVAAVAVLALVSPLVSACESTQDKSAKLAREAQKVVQQHGLTVTRVNPAVRVVSTAVIKDANGTAVVVELRNRSARTLAGLPLAINVKGAGGKSLFKNNAPGLESSLVQAALLPPHGTLTWVNDQVQAAATPHAVAARVGVTSHRAPAKLPKIGVSSPRLENDPISGVEAVGRVTNHSAIDQRFLAVFVVARRGGSVVAAGRGVVQRLRAGKSAAYKVFFIGNPKGARLTVSAPPTTFG